jgi:hypothetical protein
MHKTSNEREKLLEDIERLLAEAPDEASRLDLERLRDSINSPQLRDMAQAVENSPKRQASELVLLFHVPALPVALTASVCVLASALSLYAAMLAWNNPLILIGTRVMNLWLIAAFFGALTVLFTALSFKRSFFVRIDTDGMATRSAGTRWQHLRVGHLRWKDVRALNERADRVLEIRAADGSIFEVPQKLVNYKVLKHHLDNMVMLYGDRAPAG